VSRRLAVLGAGLVIAAGAIAATASGASRRGNEPPAAVARPPTTAAAHSPRGRPPTVRAPAAPPLGLLRRPGARGTAGRPDTPARPLRLTIKSIGVDTALQPLRRLADGSLESPSRWGRAGWYAGGVIPGEVGPAVIVGHIDSISGPAVFFRLGELRPGDPVRLTARGGRVLTFVVDGLRRYPKAHFPTEAVYGPTPDPQLRLVTCTGEFDAAAGSYLDNLVVSAHLV
jgi:hypothetical protein